MICFGKVRCCKSASAKVWHYFDPQSKTIPITSIINRESEVIDHLFDSVGRQEREKVCAISSYIHTYCAILGTKKVLVPRCFPKPLWGCEHRERKLPKKNDCLYRCSLNTFFWFYSFYSSNKGMTIYMHSG